MMFVLVFIFICLILNFLVVDMNFVLCYWIVFTFNELKIVFFFY